MVAPQKLLAFAVGKDQMLARPPQGLSWLPNSCMAILFVLAQPPVIISIPIGSWRKEGTLLARLLLPPRLAHSALPHQFRILC